MKDFRWLFMSSIQKKTKENSTFPVRRSNTQNSARKRKRRGHGNQYTNKVQEEPVVAEQQQLATNLEQQPQCSSAKKLKRNVADHESNIDNV